MVSDVSICSQTELDSALSSRDWKYTSELLKLFEKNDNDTITAVSIKPDQSKCGRCWQFTAPAETGICSRCADIVNRASRRA